MATTGTCACYFCDGYPVWQIWLAGDTARPEDTYACGIHARGQLRRPIPFQEFSQARSGALPQVDGVAMDGREVNPPSSRSLESSWRV